MVLVGSAAEKAAGIPVYAGDMKAHIKLRVLQLHELEGLLREGLKGNIHKLLKLLLVLKKPWSFVIKGKLPKEITGFFAESFEHIVGLSSTFIIYQCILTQKNE